MRIKSNVSAANLSEAVKTASIVGTQKDEEGMIDVPLTGVVLVDPTQNPALIGRCGMYITDSGGAYSVTVFGAGRDLDASNTAFATMAIQYVNNGGLGFQTVRTPSVFKTPGIISTIGDTALWTPAAGKKFRVMGFDCMIPATTTSVAGTTVVLRDATTPFLNVAVIGTTTTALFIHVQLPVNGYLSTTINNVLNGNLSAAATAGGFLFSVYGTEE